MPNSYNQDGVFNKITKEIKFYKPVGDSRSEDASDEVIAQSFGGNIETAKSHFFHPDALTNNDTNGTQLDYAITADGNGIKFTIAFGTKGTAGIAESDDWADTWSTTKDTLVSADKWIKPVADQFWTSVDATPHLL